VKRSPEGRAVTLVEIEPSGPGEPCQTIRANVVSVAGKLAHVRHDPGYIRTAPWTMLVDRKTGMPKGDWAWRVVETDLPL
jgi:hypothetical protein